MEGLVATNMKRLLLSETRRTQSLEGTQNGRRYSCCCGDLARNKVDGRATGALILKSDGDRNRGRALARCYESRDERHEAQVVAREELIGSQGTGKPMEGRVRGRWLLLA